VVCDGLAKFHFSGGANGKVQRDYSPDRNRLVDQFGRTKYTVIEIAESIVNGLFINPMIKSYLMLEQKGSYELAGSK
jgi:hypothetical protein